MQYPLLNITGSARTFDTNLKGKAMTSNVTSADTTLFVNEAVATFEQHERLQKTLIATLENLVDRLMKEQDKVLQRVTSGSMEPGGARLTLDGPSIPMKLTAWQIPGTRYYAGPCVRGLFRAVHHDNNLHILFVPYADLVKPEDNHSKDTYVSIVAGLEKILTDIKHLE